MQRILRPYVVNLTQFVDGKLSNIPDYAAIFGEDPTAAFTILSGAALLSALGWIKLPNASGLRLVAASHLLAICLLIFMGLKSITQSLLKPFSSMAAIIGLTSLVVFSPQYFHKPAEVVLQTFIHTMSMLLVLPAFQDDIFNYMDHYKTMTLAFGVLFSFSVYCIMVAATYLTLTMSSTTKDRANQSISMRTAASIISIETIGLLLSQLA